MTRILIADDKPQNLYLLEVLLKSAGYEVVTAKDGIEALEKLRSNPFDGIVSDILMPRMDGFMLLRECKKDPALRQIPFIFYTATYLEQKDEEFGLSLGAIRYLVKPSKPEELLRQIDEAFSGHARLPGDAPVHPVIDEATFSREYTLRVGAKLNKKARLLEESEEKYHLLFDNSMDAILLTSPDGSIQAANPAACAMFRMTEEEIIRNGRAGIVDASDPRLPVALEERARTGRFKGELTFLRKDRTKFPGEISSNIFTDRRGHTLTSMIIRDTTDRKSAEEEIKSANVFLDMVIDMSPFSMWISDKDGTVVRVNRSLCQAINLNPDEIVGKYNVLRDTNLEIQGVMPGVRAVFDTYTPVRFSIPWKAADAGDVDFQGAHDMYIDVSLFPILNARRELTNVVCQWVDITERKRAEESLRIAQEKYTKAFLSAPYAITLSELESGRFVEVNEAAITMFGYSRDELMGKSALELGIWLNKEDRAALRDQLMKYGRVHHYEVQEKRKSGELYDALVAADTLTIGGMNYLIAITSDVTDRKKIESQRETLIRELERKNTELERFTYTVSHDLKSPLITIKWFAGLLEDDVQKFDPVQMKKDAHRITDAAGTMQALLIDLLELAQVGSLIKPPEKTEFGTIVHEAVDLLAVPLAERGVTVEIAPDLPRVNVDHSRIREALVNLIENAIKFSGNRPDPLVRIGMDLRGEQPVFFIQDNGIGINPHYLERIFNLFEKLDASTHGTGIGLTIVRRIIEVHGGKIWAESEGPGKGTTFRFTLPVVRDGVERV